MVFWIFCCYFALFALRFTFFALVEKTKKMALFLSKRRA